MYIGVYIYMTKYSYKNMKHIINDDLFKSGIIFMIGSISVALLNYLYHVFMGRMLGPAEYGILGSLFAIIYLSTFSSNTFNRVISKYAAEFKGKNKDGCLKKLITRGFYKISLYGLIFLFVYILLTPYIAEFMNLNNTIGLIIVGVIGYFSILGSVITGALNGLQKFIWQNSLSFVSAALKLGFALLLVYLGFGVHGALIAVIIGAIVLLFIGAYSLRKEIKINGDSFNSKEIYLYAVPVFLSAILPLLLITFDQILVKHFFSSIDAGYYAAAGNIAKIIWFGSGFLVSALFPKIVMDKSRGKDASKLLTKGLIYTSFLVLIGVGIYFATPRLIVLAIYGSDYLPITAFIGMFGLALGLYSITQVFIVYNLAVEKYKFLWILLFGFLFEVAGIAIFHSSLSDIIKISLLAESFILAAMFVYNRKEIFNNDGHK